MKFKITESKETDKLYKAIADTADAIDDLADKDNESAKKNLDSADDKISDVKDGLTESNESKMVKVDKDKLKDYFLHFGGLGDIDKENIGYTAELLGYSDDGTNAIIRFNNRKDFNFKYRVPVKFISEPLKESLSEDTGVSALLNDLIQREYELLSEYESAQVTLDDHAVITFNDILDYITDDINIHIGMLEAALEDINPTSGKTEEGKEQGETLLLDESLFEDATNQITGKPIEKSVEKITKGKYCDFKADGTPILKYDKEVGAVVVPTEMKDFWDSL